MDVTIVTPLQAATMPAAAQTAGHALNHAYDQKVNEAEELCWRQGIAFLPLVAETFGGWHTGAEREVKKLGAALARHTGQEEGEAISHLWSRMGILLQRGNAAILLNGKSCGKSSGESSGKSSGKSAKTKKHIPPIVTTNICVTMFLCHCNNKYLDITTFLCHCNNKYL